MYSGTANGFPHFKFWNDAANQKAHSQLQVVSQLDSILTSVYVLNHCQLDVEGVLQYPEVLLPTSLPFVYIHTFLVYMANDFAP